MVKFGMFTGDWNAQKCAEIIRTCVPCKPHPGWYVVPNCQHLLISMDARQPCFCSWCGCPCDATQHGANCTHLTYDLDSDGCKQHRQKALQVGRDFSRWKAPPPCWTNVMSWPPTAPTGSGDELPRTSTTPSAAPAPQGPSNWAPSSSPPPPPPQPAVPAPASPLPPPGRHPWRSGALLHGNVVHGIIIAFADY